MNVGHLIQDDASVWMIGDTAHFEELRSNLASELLEQDPIHPRRWQQLDTSKSDIHRTYELKNVTIWMPMDSTMYMANMSLYPDWPWAEDHFRERIGREPINPGVEHANWPYHKSGADLHIKYTQANETVVGKYSHNYMERYWPKSLPWGGLETLDRWGRVRGYRFPIGDLDDVVNQLAEDYTTRQAYLPIFFPEDTGALDNQRVPCSLGYHFLIRDDKLHCTYFMRSCEIYRHFTNDIYMTTRLAQWVSTEVGNRAGAHIEMGQLTVHITSLHGFIGDTEQIKVLIL